MIIGVIGLGVIGRANKAGFEFNGHKVVTHDKLERSTMYDVLNADLLFLCLPTPSNSDGSCDTTIIEEVLHDLDRLNVHCPIVIRSTVTPGFTRSMQLKYPSLTIGFAPEFLRERFAVEDFIENHALLAIGSNNDNLISLVSKSHGSLPKQMRVMSPTEAELLKYYNNVYAALRITFANNMYEIAKKLDCEYAVLKESYILTGKTSGLYLDVSDELRGFAGACLPKDTAALDHLIAQMGLNISLVTAIIADNSNYKPTVFPGMRM